MGTVYILGAGASRFAGFPLGKQLLQSLRSVGKKGTGIQLCVSMDCELGDREKSLVTAILCCYMP